MYSPYSSEGLPVYRKTFTATNISIIELWSLKSLWLLLDNNFFLFLIKITINTKILIINSSFTGKKYQTNFPNDFFKKTLFITVDLNTLHKMCNKCFHDDNPRQRNELHWNHVNLARVSHQYLISHHENTPAYNPDSNLQLT